MCSYCQSSCVASRRSPRLSVVHECIHQMGLRTDNRLNLGCHQRRGGVWVGVRGGGNQQAVGRAVTDNLHLEGAEPAQSGQRAARMSPRAMSQSLIAFGRQKTVVSDRLITAGSRRLGCGQGNDSRKTYVLHSKARWQRKLLHHPAPGVLTLHVQRRRTPTPFNPPLSRHWVSCGAA